MSETLGGGTSSSSPLSPFPRVRGRKGTVGKLCWRSTAILDGWIFLVRECGCGSHSIRLAGIVSLVDGNIVRIDIFLAVNNPCRNAEQCVNTSLVLSVQKKGCPICSCGQASWRRFFGHTSIVWIEPPLTCSLPTILLWTPQPHLRFQFVVSQSE